MAESQIDVAYVAHLARLKLSPEETARYEKQLGDVLHYVAALQKADVSKVAPPEDDPAYENNLREDAERPSLPLEAALSNAPEQGNGLFMVPRMVE
ncbi:MAG: Asp-tRNA(Asn)/Glu-tRNA(Gln) amidotransferase subunit GatC [Verrucomicrobium sp.]|nr:Asp-tRNA(Asn)/Glu-tRNA(Gln) amidotransferase subunit GatC [Verrucomicrobium sp.]